MYIAYNTDIVVKICKLHYTILISYAFFIYFSIAQVSLREQYFSCFKEEV